ncbi:MAG: glycoside hydrolase family 3 protein [Nigerium sp.]|nr:glycoside hydrolase family 3 protein [Nigerium sp.]
MLGVTGDLDSAESAAITNGAAGSVILMGNTTGGVAATKARTQAIAKLAGPSGMLIAVDQEGGTVQRLKGPGFDTMPSAREQAKLPASELAAEAKRWGGQLAEAGVQLALAPVADVVPADRASTNEPIGKLGRGYGSTPEAVAGHVVAFITGMDAAGVATSPKHFPNLGRVVGNTDFVSKVVDDETTRDDPALEPYRQAIEAGVETVMVATAFYTKIDPDAPAAFSRAVVGILRDDLGFDGVIVSDDLGVAKAVASVPASERAVRFVRAGGDLAISVDPVAGVRMIEGLTSAAERDPEFAARVTESSARVLGLKAARGLTTCDAVVG